MIKMRQRRVAQAFGIFFDVHMDKRLNKNGVAGDLARNISHVTLL